MHAIAADDESALIFTLLKSRSKSLKIIFQQKKFVRTSTSAWQVKCANFKRGKRTNAADDDTVHFVLQNYGNL